MFSQNSLKKRNTEKKKSLNDFDVNCLFFIFVITFFLSFFAIDPWESSNESLEEDLKQFTNLKKTNPNLKVCVCSDKILIGQNSRQLNKKLNHHSFRQVLLGVGRNLQTYSEIVTNPNKLEETVANSRDFIFEHNLDGIYLQLDDGYVFKSVF